MLKVYYKPTFIRQFKRMPLNLQEEIRGKIAIFQTDQFHPFLKTHKLKGSLKNCYSFYVNYKYRIVFEYESKDEVVLLAVGDHSIYD